MSHGREICCFTGVLSFLIYIIGVGLAWVFSRVLYTQSGLAYVAAIVIAIPLIVAVMGFLALGCCIMVLGGIFGDIDSIAGFVVGRLLGIFCGLLSALFDLVGITLLIVAMINAPDNLMNPAGPIACGAFAVLFVMVSGITNLVAIISYGCLKKENTSGAE